MSLAISVVIPTRNRADLLSETLASLAAQTIGLDGFEVVVVDDGSTDHTAAVCEEHARTLTLVYRRTAPSGIAAAKNLGLFLAAAGLVLFFDDDDLAAPDLLEAHVATHVENPAERIAVLGHTTWARHLQVSPLMHYVTDVGYHLFSYGLIKPRTPLDYTYFWGGRTSVKKAFLARHGVFDQRFEFGSEDIELGYRLAKHGLTVAYMPQARSLMNRAVTYDDFLRRAERQGRSQLQFSRLHDAPEIQAYCQVDHAHERWLAASTSFEARVHRVHTLEGQLAEGGRSAAAKAATLEELHDLYGSTIVDAKLKGIVEEARALGEGEARRAGADRARIAVKWGDGLAGHEPESPNLERRASNCAPGKRILVVDHYLPIHDRASGSRRLFEVLRLLAGQGHAVTFVARDARHGERYVDELEELGIEVRAETPLPGLRPFDPLELLHDGDFDLAYLSFFHTAEAYLELIRTVSPRTRVVVDTVDLHWVRLEREAEVLGDADIARSAAEVRRRELAVYRQADALVVVTGVERATLLEELPGASVHVVPNIHEAGGDAAGPDGREGLLFVGNFNHTPNRDAVEFLVREILPLVHRELPDVGLTVVGGDPTPQVRDLACETVEVTGWVPDVAPYLAAARLSVAPLRYGAGLKGKVGEALGAGLPVVTTSVGAEGLLEHGEQALLVADDAASFAREIVRAYRDDALWRSLSAAGRRCIEAAYAPEAVAGAVGTLVERETAQPRPVPVASIVVLVHEQLELTLECLERIERHTPEPHEVIVVDNGSTTPTQRALREYASAHPNARLVVNATNRGYAAGNNQGIAVATGEHLVFLNNDVLVTDGWLPGLLAALERHPGAGLSGPMTNRVSGEQLVADADYESRDDLDAFAARWHDRHAGESETCFRIVGFCLLARREVIERIGGFDERFGPGNLEDDDLCIRAKLDGFDSVIARDVFVHHEGGQTFEAARIDHRQAMIRNWGIFKEKWGIPASQAIGSDYHVSVASIPVHGFRIPPERLALDHISEQGARIWAEPLGRSAYLRVASATDNGSIENLRLAFAEVHAWDDPHRRYEMRKRMVEMVLGTPSREGLAWTRLFGVAADELLDVLEAEPAEPILLNYCGVLLFELAQAEAARALFEAARRLDPTLPHIDDNVRQARQLGRGGVRLHKAVALRTAALAERARRVAALAKPAEGLRLSLCMIVKDEEAMLPGCLEPVHRHVDEIIVVDTGSTDRTVEIAESFGAKVVHHRWNGSFADARNVSLEHATGDWIVYLDADEHVLPDDAPKLRTLLGKTWREGFHIAETNYTGGDESGPAVTHLALRLFRNRPEYRFEGRIHEQKTHNMPTYLPERFENAPVRMLHYGYLKGRIVERGKTRRNLELLEREALESPSPFNDYNLGCEYLRLQDLPRARAHFEAAWTALGSGWTSVGYASTLVARLGSARRLTADTKAAREALEAGLAAFEGHTDLVLELALCARDDGALDEAEELAARCLEMGDAPAQYIATVGAGTFLALNLLADLRRVRGDVAGAQRMWRDSLADHPDYLAPLLPLVSSLVSAGAAPAEVASAVPPDRPLAMVLAGTAYVENGFAEEAEPWFRAALERQPGDGVARIGLIESLLARKRFAEAAEEAVRQPEGSPLEAACAAAALFAHAVLADGPHLAEALERAESAGVAGHDLAFYRAWLAVLDGTPLPAELPGESASCALVALEAMLRVQEFEAFEAAMHVYGRIGLEPRLRRELVARMYLRRGYLDSAAEEWLTAAREAPDAAAFLGLAQVAHARGDAADALELLEGALRIDPDCGEAARMRSRLAERALAA